MLTNWMNGMKINNFHLENSETAQLSELQRSLSIYINENNYGVYCNDQKHGESFDCSISKSIGDNYLIKLTKLRGVTYTRKDTDDKSRKVGVIAQEVLPILPEVVQKDTNGNYSVAYGNIVGVLIEAIKELKAEIDILKNK